MSDEKNETVGGTAARIEAGKEGRGGARRQRKPELYADLKGECKKLAEQAIQVADHLGHKECVIWQVNADANCGQIKCPLCDQRAGFAVSPRQKKVRDPLRKGKVMYIPGEKISGIAVTERCNG